MHRQSKSYSCLWILLSKNFELSNNKILNYKMLYVYILYYVSIHLDDRICMYIFEYIIYLPLL